MNKHIIFTILTVVLVVILIAGTFFLFTASTATAPKALNLFVPSENETTKISIPDTATVFNIIAFADDKYYCYPGDSIKNGKVLTIEKENTIRNFILKTKREFGQKGLTIIIKPTPATNYKSTVNILDEMTINDIKRFLVIDVTQEEEAFIMKNIGKN